MLWHTACPSLEAPLFEVASVGPVISEYSTPELSPPVLPIAQPLKSAIAPLKPKAKINLFLIQAPLSKNLRTKKADTRRNSIKKKKKQVKWLLKNILRYICP